MLRWRPRLVLPVVLLVLAVLLQAPLPAQIGADGRSTSAPLDRTVRGIVIDASGRPLPHATVSVSLATAAVDPVRTDEQGAFVVAIPAGGTPRLRVSKAGYTPMLVAVRFDAELQIPLTRGASISGRVVTSTGVPSPGALVLAQRDASASWSATPRQASAVADARGEYRVFGLAPGRYTLSVVQQPTPPSVGSSTRRQFLEQMRDGSLDYPFKPLSMSTTIDLGPGDAVEQHDLQLAERRPCAIRVTPDRRIANGTARLGGRVMGPSGPLDCAEVLLTQAGAVAMRTAATDAAGRFTFDRLAAGIYTLQAGGFGYAQGGLGYAQHTYGETAQRPGRLLTLREGETRNDLTLTVSPAPLISGVVYDEYGEPVERVSVGALEVRHEDGYDVARFAEGLGAITDDRGAFRVAAGRPGSYILRIDPRDPETEPDRAIMALFYPGTPDAAQAERIRVGSVGDVVGLQVSLRPQAGAQVSGSALRSNGQPLAGSVRLVTNKRAGTLIMPPRSATVDSQGGFRFNGVPPGDYVVQAHGSGATGDFGLDYVQTVAGDVSSVSLIARPRATIEGRLVIEGPQDTPRAPFAVVAVNTDPDYLTRNAAPMQLVVNADGSVRGDGLIGSTRFILEAAPAGWYLKSVNIEGIDATRVPFDFGATGRPYRNVEVVVSNASGSIAGRASDRRGAPVRDYAVTVFSVDSADWFGSSNRLRLARADVDGGFHVSGLPPGDYWVAAASRLDPSSLTGGWRQPEVLARLMPSAQRVTVTESQTVNATIRIAD